MSKRRGLQSGLESLESRQLLAALSGVVFDDVNLDGVQQSTEADVADVRVFLDDNANGAFDDGELFALTDSQGVYSFTGLAGGDYDIRIEPGLGRVQVNPAVTYGYSNTAVTAADGSLERASQLFTLEGDGNIEFVGQATSDRMDGLVRIADGDLIAADFKSNIIFRVDPDIGEIDRIGNTNRDIVSGLAYDPVGNQVLTLVRGTADASLRQLAQVNVNTGEVTPIGAGRTGLESITDLAFDVPNRRVLAFDDFDNEFVAFDLSGNVTTLSFATALQDNPGGLGQSLQPIDIDSESMAIAGFEWTGSTSTFGTQVLMFDEDDRDGTQTWIVNVDTGIVAQGTDVEAPIMVNTLDRPRSGNVATLVSVTEFETVGDLNIGVTQDVIGFRVTPAIASGAIGVISGQGVTVVGGAVGDDVVEVSLNRAPESNVQLNLSLDNPSGGDPGVILDQTSLVFTPTDWFTPRRVTLSPDPNDLTTQITSIDLTVAIDATLSDPEWATLPNQSLPVRVLPQPEDVDFTVPVINELLLGGTDVTETTDQFVELRGLPNGVLPQGTYFVTIDDGTFDGGEVETVIDLSGQSFGVNGFLVLLQQNSPYTSAFGSRVLQSDEIGFSGLPGGIFSGVQDSGELSDSFFTVDATTYMLIQSDTPPMLNDDIDVDEDGLLDPDGIAADWVIFDSLSMQPFVGGSDNSYGRIVGVDDVFDSRTAITVPEGATVVFGDGIGYAARVGDSLGSRSEDWIFADVALAGGDFGNTDADAPELLEVGQGRSEYHPLFDRALDHVGESNFVGGIRGQISLLPALDEVSDPSTDEATLPGEGILVFADLNGNGVRDTVTVTADPDDLIPPFDFRNPGLQDLIYPATQAFPGLTVSQSTFRDGLDDTVFAGREERGNRTLNNRVFDTQFGFGFDDGDALRFDFFNPVRSVTIDAIPLDFAFQTSIPSLVAYDANGLIIATVTGEPTSFGASQTITISSALDNIVRVDAFGSDVVGFDGMLFDNLVYEQIEPGALTDQNGIYELINLTPGLYDVNIVSTQATGTLLGNTQRTVPIFGTQNLFFEDELRPNSVPVSSDQIIAIDENLAAGSLIGTVDAQDADDIGFSSLTYELIGGIGRGFIVDSLTGAITVASSATLDFETDPIRILTVRASDPLGDSTTSRVTVAIRDINEAPVVDGSDLLITEVIPAGTTIGRIPAMDPDTDLGQTLTYQVIGGDAANFFSVDPDTGVVTLTDPSGVNFEIVNTMELQLRISDSADPAAIADVTQTILISDENDPAVFDTTQFTVPENSTGELFTLTVTDPEPSQTHRFELFTQPNPPLLEVSDSGVVSLLPDAELDFEAFTATTDQITFQVTSTDNGLPPIPVTETITVNITAVNEPARLRSAAEPQLEEVSIAENMSAPVGSDPLIIGQLVLVDVDSPITDSEVQWLPQGLDDIFTYDATARTIALLPGVSLDAEQQDAYELVFEVTDTSDPNATAQQLITVRVDDVNESPSLLTDRFVVSETPSVGDVIGQLRVSDPESDALVTRITGGTAADFFTLVDESHFAGGPQDDCTAPAGDGTALFLCVAADVTFDVESDPPAEGWTLDIGVADGTNPEVIQTVTLGVNDVNEAPTFNPEALAEFLNRVNAATKERLQEFRVELPEALAADPEGTPFILRVFDEAGGLPNWLTFDEANGVLFGTPSLFDFGTFDLTLRAIEFGPFPRRTDTTFSIEIPGGASPFTNPLDRFDVNASGDVSSLDALRVVNYLNENGPGPIDASGFSAEFGFVDANGDGEVDAVDALAIVNEINRRRQSQIASESIDAVSSDRAASIADEDRQDAIDAALRADYGSAVLF